jgi:UDP-glucose 4-epimerase
LINAGYKVIIIDNLYNSSDEVLNRIQHLTGTKPELFNVDITNKEALDKVFASNPDIDSVIHFAALKAVGESSEIPLDYWRVNVGGTLNLLKAMEDHNVTNIVFSSSATVYGNPSVIPIPETSLIKAANPYGHTKVANEDMITAQILALRKKAAKNGKPVDAYNAALLRYFNPCGAHPAGIMGEDPQGIPFNLLPIAAQVATGKRASLAVYGTGEYFPPPKYDILTNNRLEGKQRQDMYS